MVPTESPSTTQLAVAPAGDDRLVLSGSLRPGGFAVGYRRETLRLAPASATMPTAVTIDLWFPVASPQAAEGRRMTLADYYRVQETSEPRPEELRAWLREDMTSPPGLDDATLDRVLASPLWASLDADPAPGPYPLVLWSYRDSVSTLQTPLNEFLASHGYVVAFAWPVDRVPPFPWEEGLDETAKAMALETQVDLLERVLESLLDRSFIDDGRTTVLAWSYGGESAHHLQRRRDEIRLAVGIDSTLVRGWVYRPSSDLETLDRAELDVPYAVLQHGRPFLGGEVTPAAPLLSEIPAEGWFVRFPALSHGNFNFPGGMLPGLLELAEVSRWAVGGEIARTGYEEICRHLLGLLERYHRDDPSPPASWSAAAPGFVEIHRY